MLMSRCSGPLLRTLSGVSLLSGCHRALGTFCNMLGDCSHCLHFIFLAKIAGFTRMDMFDSLGRLGSVDVGPRCTAMYNVAGRRLVSAFAPRLRGLTRAGRLAPRRAFRGVGTLCSNCRFYRFARKMFGPFDILGIFSKCGFDGC